MSNQQTVFISHSSKDKNFANAICHTLESNGIRCWIAPRDITPGMDYGASIIGAIEKCRIMVVVFTSNANESRPVNNEIERAVSKGAIVIPVRFQDVAPNKNLEFFISSSHWLDAFTEPVDEHLEKLSSTIKLLLENSNSIVTDEKVMEETVQKMKPLNALVVEKGQVTKHEESKAVNKEPVAAKDELTGERKNKSAVPVLLFVVFLLLVGVGFFLKFYHGAPAQVQAAPVSDTTQHNANFNGFEASTPNYGIVTAAEDLAKQNPTAENYVKLSRTYFGFARYPECINAAELSIKIKPSREAYNGICSAYLAQRQWDNAIAAAEKAMALDPSAKSAKQYAESEKRGIKSPLDSAESLVEQHPVADNIARLSLLYYNQGRYLDCIRATEQLLKLHPEMRSAYNAICAGYLGLRDYDNAVIAGKRAVDSDPSNKQFQNNLKIAMGGKDNAEKETGTKTTSAKLGGNYAGGVVFYVAPASTDGKPHGLVCAADDQVGSADWNEAVRKCKLLKLGGYADWYLPSKDELLMIYKNLGKRGVLDFSKYACWSSTPAAGNTAVFVSFGDGSVVNEDKSTALYYRPVRKF